MKAAPEHKLAARIKKAHPRAAGLLDEVVALIQAPANVSGTDQFEAEEGRLDQLAIELGRLIPREEHADLGALLDEARLSLTKRA